MRLLLVEDDELLGEGVKDALIRAQYAVDWVMDGEAALHAIEVESFDLIVLDLGLPKIDGLTVLKQMRHKSINTAVIILTAKDALEDRLAGLDAGADDYVNKPFELAELKARIRAISRRVAGTGNPTLKVGPLTLDPKSAEVTKSGKPVLLSRREYQFLHQLMQHSNEILSKERLFQGIYDWSDDVSSNTVDVHIHNLRKKLGENLIKNTRGLGYSIDTAKHTEKHTGNDC